MVPWSFAHPKHHLSNHFHVSSWLVIGGGCPKIDHSHWGSRPAVEPASCAIVFTPSSLTEIPLFSVHRQGASERKPCFRSILRTSASSGGRIQWPFETLCDRKASARQALKGKLTCFGTCLRMLQLHRFANMKTQKRLDERWQETSLNLRKKSEKVSPADGSNDIFLNLPVWCGGTAMGDSVRLWKTLECNVKGGHFPKKKQN